MVVENRKLIEWKRRKKEAFKPRNKNSLLVERVNAIFIFNSDHGKRRREEGERGKGKEREEVGRKL